MTDATHCQTDAYRGSCPERSLTFVSPFFLLDTFYLPVVIKLWVSSLPY